MKRITVMILCLVLCVVMGGESILSAFSIPIMADGTEEIKTEYSLGYNDLLADKSFDPDEYPVIEDDYGLHLITVAESENDELFVYVYQPSGTAADFRASSINISLSARTDNKFKNYSLTYLNSYGTIYKYKVTDLVVSSDATRYYEIPSIFRVWNESYDAPVGGDNAVDEVSFPVGKLFVFTDVADGSVQVRAEDVEYIRVTDKYVGYVRYEQDVPLFVLADEAVDAHFVAFSTDRQIDELLEADVYYYVQTYTSGSAGSYWGDKVYGEKYLDYTQMAECEISDGSYWTHSEHIWKRIQKTSDFLKNDTPLYIFPGFSVEQDLPFTDEAKAELAKTEWVLSFVETEFEYKEGTGIMGIPTERYSRVGEVTILRLKFKTDGVVYDLGVVDNKQTGSEDPAATVEEQEWWQKIMMILMLILLIVGLSFLSGPVGLVARLLWGGIKAIAELLLWLLGAPFRLLRWLFQQLSSRKGRSK